MQLKPVYLSSHTGTSLLSSIGVRQVTTETKRRNGIEVEKGQEKREAPRTIGDTQGKKGKVLGLV